MYLVPRTFHFLDEWLLLSLRICPNMSSLKASWNHQEVRSLLVLLEKSEHLISPHSTLGVLLVIVAFWGREMKTKRILVLLLLFFSNSSYVDSLLMTFYLMWGGLTHTNKPIYGWVGTMSLFPLNKEQKVWKAINRVRQEREGSLWSEKKIKTKFFSIDLVFISLKLLFLWENDSLFYSLRDMKGGQFWWQDLNLPAGYVVGQGSHEETGYFIKTPASLLWAECNEEKQQLEGEALLETVALGQCISNQA